MKNEIIIFEDVDIKLEVSMQDETVWLTQQQMADLFATTQQNISSHVKNIFEEKELKEISVHKKILYTASDGKEYRAKIYNLDVIISVGYRVKSKRGTQFRQWANKVLKDYMLNGKATNQKRIEYLEKTKTIKFTIE
jgi:hypothetical protein